MAKIEYSKEFFNIKDTLLCGQIFRYEKYDNGYRVFSKDKECFIYEKDDKVHIESEDIVYFYNFFDLDNDYSKIYNFAKSTGVEIIEKSARLGKGIRILKQDILEMTFSFIISQNNNIPRIKNSINLLCKKFGKLIENKRGAYYSFFSEESVVDIANTPLKDFGLGYRDSYITNLANKIVNGYNLYSLEQLSRQEIYNSLLQNKGIGDKVANCILLFGYNKTNSFPVDTWIEKVYKENMLGTLSDRKKISEYFTNYFGEYAGYIQQYLFYYKRSLENK